MPSPTLSPELYDAIVLGGRVSPGVVKLSGHDREFKWDVKEGNGQDGASSTYKGAKLASFTATFALADDEDRDAWETFEAIIRGMVEGASATALAIYHPDLARNRIDAVSTGKIGGMTHDGMGGSTVVVTFQEYKPAKKKSSTPSGAKSQAKGGAGDPAKADDPNAAAKAELEALLKEAEAP
jgi:hypothetical protein